MKFEFIDINKPIEFPIRLDLNAFNKTYSNDIINKFNKVEGLIKIEKVNKVYIFKISILANLNITSSLSLKKFDKEFDIKETLYFTNDEEYESEDTEYVDGLLDIDNLIFSLLITNIPITIHAPDEDKEIVGEGYRAIKEEDIKKEQTHSSPFDILDDLDLD